MLTIEKLIIDNYWDNLRASRASNEPIGGVEIGREPEYYEEIDKEFRNLGFWADSSVREISEIDHPIVLELLIAIFEAAPSDLNGAAGYFILGPFDTFMKYASVESKRKIVSVMCKDPEIDEILQMYGYLDFLIS